MPNTAYRSEVHTVGGQQRGADTEMQRADPEMPIGRATNPTLEGDKWPEKLAVHQSDKPQRDSEKNNLKGETLDPRCQDGEVDESIVQEWKFMSCSHCKELCQQASWLLIGCPRVYNQSD